MFFLPVRDPCRSGVTFSDRLLWHYLLSLHLMCKPIHLTIQGSHLKEWDGYVGMGRVCLNTCGISMISGTDAVQCTAWLISSTVCLRLQEFFN